MIYMLWNEFCMILGIHLGIFDIFTSFFWLEKLIIFMDDSILFCETVKFLLRWCRVIFMENKIAVEMRLFCCWHGVLTIRPLHFSEYQLPNQNFFWEETWIGVIPTFHSKRLKAIYAAMGLLIFRNPILCCSPETYYFPFN